MSTTNSLVSEMNTLRAAVAAHRERVIAAQEARDMAIEAAGIPVKYGRYDLDFDRDAWRYPSVAEAIRAATKLEDDNGYFWACSRLRDLETLLGQVPGDQLPLRTAQNFVPLLHGSIPEANPWVTDFLAAA